MKLTDLIPYINAGETVQQLATRFNVGHATISRYKQILKAKGYTFKSKNGRPFKLDIN
jgi:transposase